MKKTSKTLSALLMGAVLLTGCAAPAATEATQTAETKSEAVAAASETETVGESGDNSLEKVVVTYVTSPLNIPSIVEKNQKIFENAFSESGIPVEYAEITSGADQTQALASGDVQFLYAVGGSSVVLSAANGADIKILNMYSRSPKAFCIYTSDETLTTPESLKGKTIVGPVGTNLHELLAAYLATADMTMDDVNFMNMTIADAKTALASKNADVALLAGAAAYQAEQEGYKLVTDGEGLIDAIIAVAVTDKFYQENPEIVETFKSAEEDVMKFVSENHEEAVLEAASELDLDQQAVEDMYQFYDFSMETTEHDVEGLQRTAGFMLEAGMMDRAVDVSELFIK